MIKRNEKNNIDIAIQEIAVEKKYKIQKTGENNRIYVFEDFLVVDAEKRIVQIMRMRYKIKSCSQVSEIKTKIKKIVNSKLNAIRNIEFNKRQNKLF